MVGLEIQAGGELLARSRQRARGLFAGVFEANDQIFATPAQLLDHIVADLPERHRDVLALLGKRMGDAFGSLVDLLADEIADGRQVLRQIDMHIVDGRTHLFGLPHQRVALVRQILQQSADPDLVVAVGALERGHLVAHHCFEFARPRQRPLDAVAHGRDFTADRLSDGDDRFACNTLWFGKPHGDLRHRLRDQPQLLGAPGHVRHTEEENNRQQCCRAEPDQDRQRRVIGAERGADVAQIGPGKRETADDPGAGEYRGDEIGGAGRAVLQRAQYLADRLLIVVGGGISALVACRRTDLLGFEKIWSGNRRTVVPVLVRGGVFGNAFRAVIRQIVVVADFERFLDRRQRRLGRIHDLFRIVGHIGRRLANYAGLGRPERTRPHPRARDRSVTHPHEGSPALMSYCQAPSYSSGGSKETELLTSF